MAIGSSVGEEKTRVRHRARICVGATVALVATAALLPHQRFAAAFLVTTGVVYAAILASQARGRLRDALLLLTALLVVPAIAEAIVAASDPRVPMVRYSPPLTRADPILGYAPIPSSRVSALKVDGDGHAIFNVTYTTDEHALRRTESNPSGPTVAFFFDSMTFGEGVEDNETLPQQFAFASGGRYRVVNLGFPGYGPQAMLRTLETGLHDDVLHPHPRFFIVQTAAWHAERAACRPEFVWRTPRYALVEGQVVFQGPCAKGLDLWGLRKLNESHVYRRMVQPLLADRQRDLDLYLAELRATRRMAADKYGAQAVILYYRSAPDQFAGTTYTDDDIIEALRAVGDVVIDVSLAERGIDGLAILGDGHPTAKAHRMHAALLWGELQRRGLAAENQ